MTKPAADTGPARGRPLASGTPLLLLPARIETRFVDTADGSASLLLRVYPDTISISSFEPELTQGEIDAGQAYWDVVWRAGSPPPDPDAVRAPWRVLAGSYTPQRAAWIALQLTPSNLAQQPAAPTPAGQPPSPAPVYPAPPTRASSYEQAPAAAALPSAWTVALTAGSATRQVTGSPITPGLAVGLDPHDGTLPDGLPVDAGMRWLVDFDEAVAAGMALRIPHQRHRAGQGLRPHHRLRPVRREDRRTRRREPGCPARRAPLHRRDRLRPAGRRPPTTPRTRPPRTASRIPATTSASRSSGKRRSPPRRTRTDRWSPRCSASRRQRSTTSGTPTATGYATAGTCSPRCGRQRSATSSTSCSPRSSARPHSPPRAHSRWPTRYPAAALPALRVGPTPYGILPVTALAADSGNATARLGRRGGRAAPPACCRPGRPAPQQPRTSARPATPTRTWRRCSAWTPARWASGPARSSATTRCGTCCSSFGPRAADRMVAGAPGPWAATARRTRPH